MTTVRAARREVLLRLEASDLPGAGCLGYAGIRVGVQRRGRREELLGDVPGNAPSVVWELPCTVGPGGLGGPDVRGPYVSGGPGARFVYLSWTSAVDGGRALFRRAKVLLDGGCPPQLWAGVVVVGRFGLTDAKGNPTCGRLAPPLVVWGPGAG